MDEDVWYLFNWHKFYLLNLKKMNGPKFVGPNKFVGSQGLFTIKTDAKMSIIIKNIKWSIVNTA